MPNEFRGRSLRAARVERDVRAEELGLKVRPPVTAETIRSWERQDEVIPDEVVDRFFAGLVELEAEREKQNAPIREDPALKDQLPSAASFAPSSRAVAR